MTSAFHPSLGTLTARGGWPVPSRARVRATIAEILADFPTLGEEDVRAAIAFAAASAQEDLPLPEIRVKRPA